MAPTRCAPPGWKNWPRRATACRRWCIRGPMSAPRRISVPGLWCWRWPLLEQGAIVNMGAIADHDCVIGACAHLAPGAIVKAGNTVPAQMKIESGTVLERGAAFLPLGGQHV